MRRPLRMTCTKKKNKLPSPSRSHSPTWSVLLTRTHSSCVEVAISASAFAQTMHCSHDRRSESLTLRGCASTKFVARFWRIWRVCVPCRPFGSKLAGLTASCATAASSGTAPSCRVKSAFSLSQLRPCSADLKVVVCFA